MPAIAVVVGLLLSVLGVGGYVATDRVSPTALIPTGLGVLIIVFGLLARQDKMRMHAMHGAVLLGLIGFLGGIAMIVRALMGDTPLDQLTTGKQIAFGMNVAMALICGVFVGLCVKSFIDARKRRQAGGS